MRHPIHWLLAALCAFLLVVGLTQPAPASPEQLAIHADVRDGGARENAEPQAAAAEAGWAAAQD